MFYDRMKKTSRSPWPIVIMTAWCALLGEMTPWARAQELAVNERLPAIMVLPFRELKDATEGMGAGLTDLLTVRFANEIGFRVLEPASDGAVLRELEIVVTAQTPHHAPDRYGVDGILSGSIFVDGDRLLLTWRLSCLVEESETGGWHELETSSFFDAGFDQLATQIAPVIEQWAGKRRVAYARESELRAERLAALPSLARRVVLLRVREQSLHGEALDGGVSMGQVIEVCREAGLSVRSPSATGDLADALYIDGTAESEEPAYRAGRSVARASCTLRLREGDNPVAVVEATAARVFAASAPREAVNAALAGAAEDAALELLYKYEKRMRARTHQVAERPRSERGRTSRATCVAIDVDADRDDLLRAMRDLVAIALNDDPQFVPVIRELVDTSTRTGHATPSPAGALQVPATYSIVLSRIESDVAGHLLDTRTGELLAMATAALADGYGAAAQGLVAAMSRAIDAHVVDRPAPARWVAMGTLLDIDAGKVARERIAHWMLRRLLDRQDVRVLVRPWSWVVARERGLGLDDALLWECDAEVRAELAQGRKDDTPGLWLSMMLGMDGDDVEHHDPVFLSADASSSWDLRVGDALLAVLNYQRVTPEAYAAGAMHLLTTSNAYAFVVAMQPDEVRSGNVSESMLLTAVMNRITGRLRHFSRNTSALDMRHEIRYPFHSLALRDKLLDYLRSAPRPLPLPVRRLLGASMRVPHTRVVVLGDAVRPEDPLPPLMEASPAAPATATTAAPPPSDTWSLHRVSDHTRWLNPNPSLAWVSGPRYYQIKSSSDRLQVQWMDVFTGETGDSGDVIQSLTDADTIVTGHSVRHFAFDGDHYLQIGRSFSRIEPDESLVRLPLFPGMSIRGMSCGIGRLLVTATPGRLQVWDRETDTLRDLANHKSTRPGGLNNRGRWDAVSLRPVLETGHVEALLLGSVRVDPPAAGFRQTLEQWSVDPASGQTTLLRRVYTSASLHAPGVRVVDTEDGFLIPKGGGLPGSPSARAWHLLPHAADRPIMSLTELRSGGPISQPVGGNHRIIGAELRGRHTGLVIIDGVDSGDYRTIRVIPSAADHVTARILRGQLLRIENDLVIAADGYSGPYRIPNAFSRTLPPVGSEIRLVMAADRLPWRRCQPHFCSCASGYRDLSTDFTGDGQMR